MKKKLSIVSRTALGAALFYAAWPSLRWLAQDVGYPAVSLVVLGFLGLLCWPVPRDFAGLFPEANRRECAWSLAAGVLFCIALLLFFERIWVDGGSAGTVDAFYAQF